MAAWLVPAVVLTALSAVAIRLAAIEQPAAVEGWVSLAPGTTAVYEATSGGRAAGDVVVQNTGGATLLVPPGVSAPAMRVTVAFSDYPGAGAVRFDVFQAARGDDLVELGTVSRGRAAVTDPPRPVLRLPLEPGRSWTWKGTSAENRYEETSTVTTVGPATVLGEERAGCADVRTVTTALDRGPRPDISERTICPRMGVVSERVTFADGTILEVRLARLVTPGAASGTPPPLRITETGPGAVTGIEPGRSHHVAGAALDTGAAPMTDDRSRAIRHPPLDAGGIAVVADEGGDLVATDTERGEVRWRVRLAGPLPVAPAVAGSLLVAAGRDKVVAALDVATGHARWLVPLDDVPSSAPVPIDGAVALVGHDRRVQALDLVDGAARWAYTLAEHVRRPAVTTGGALIVADTSGALVALDSATGTLRWEARTDFAPEAGPAASAGLVVVVDESATLYAFDSATGRLRWVRGLDARTTIPPVVANDLVVVAPGDSRLVALDAASGQPRWRARAGRLRTAPVALGETLAVVDERGSLTPADLATGRAEAPVPPPLPLQSVVAEAVTPLAWVGERLVVTLTLEGVWPLARLVWWPAGRLGHGVSGVAISAEVRTVPAALSGAPALVGPDLVVPTRGGVAVAAPSSRALTDDDTFYAVPAGDRVLAQSGTDLVAVPLRGGPPEWTFPVGEPFPGTAPAVAGAVVFTPVAGRGLAALDRDTGISLWEAEIRGGAGSSAPVPMPGGDVVYAVGGLARFDGGTGAVLWRLPGTESFSLPALDGDVVLAVVIGFGGSHLVAVDATTGALRWRRATEPAPLIGPAAGSGVAVLVDDRGRTVAVDVATGDELWSLRMETRAGSSPIVTGDRVAVLERGTENDVIADRGDRLTIHHLRSGRLLAAFEPPGSAFDLNGFAAAGQRLLVPAAPGFLAVLVLDVAL